jgi:hypothetical protein
MAEKALRVEDLVIGSNNGFVFVGVSPEHVAEVQRLLADLGIGSSLHTMEEGESTVIHPHTNLAPSRVHGLLSGQGWPGRKGGHRRHEPDNGQS